MFERYTEKARRVVFFARYEASQYGSPTIESEHFLLGLLREDQAMLAAFIPSANAAEDIRAEVEKRTTVGQKISTSVDLPLTADCKAALADAAEEAERLAQRTVGTEHLLLGLLRVEKSIAADILRGRGLDLAQVRETLAGSSARPREQVRPSGDNYRYVHLDV